jgi:hypothetical protein
MLKKPKNGKKSYINNSLILYKILTIISFYLLWNNKIINKSNNNNKIMKHAILLLSSYGINYMNNFLSQFHNDKRFDIYIHLDDQSKRDVENNKTITKSNIKYINHLYKSEKYSIEIVDTMFELLSIADKTSNYDYFHYFSDTCYLITTLEEFYNFFEKNNKKIKLNYFDILSGFKDDIKILQAISTLFYAFSCHVGVFPVLNTLKNPTQKRIKILFKKSISLDIICYLIIGISGYLTQPENTPDLIIERKKIFDNDFLMIIGQICFIFTLIAKICANYNALRICIINLFNKNKSKNQISNKINLILTTCCLIITTLISIIFQSISSYISLIGGFCSVIISILIPGFIYIKGVQELKINNKTIFAGIIIIILTLIGFTNGILTIKNVVNRK